MQTARQTENRGLRPAGFHGEGRRTASAVLGTCVREIRRVLRGSVTTGGIRSFFFCSSIFIIGSDETSPSESNTLTSVHGTVASTGNYSTRKCRVFALQVATSAEFVDNLGTDHHVGNWLRLKPSDSYAV